MSMVFSEEMKRLFDKTKPYLDGCNLRKDAPADVVEANERFMTLFYRERKKAMQLL